MLVEHKRLKRLFDALDFTPVQGLLLEAYHRSGPGRQFYDSEAVVKAFMLQRFERLPSERVLTEQLAKSRDYRRICRFKRKTPSRECFTHFRRKRLGVESFMKAFNAMVEQALSLEAVKGYALAFAVDSTAFKAYSARDASNKRGKSDPDADVVRAGRTYILGYRVHLACAEGDVPVAFTVQPIPTCYGRSGKKPEGLRVDAKFKVSGPKRMVKAYHKRLCVERVFKKLKRQLSLETHYLRGWQTSQYMPA